MTTFVFLIANSQYEVLASDFAAATGYINENIRCGWGFGFLWIPAGKKNTYRLG